MELVFDHGEPRRDDGQIRKVHLSMPTRGLFHADLDAPVLNRFAAHKPFVPVEHHPFASERFSHERMVHGIRGNDEA